MTYQQCEISSFADIQSRLLRDSIALWHRGEFAAAFQAVLHSVALNADDIQAHTLVFYWIWQSSDADGERLAALWADSYLPTMGVDICEEALIEAFCDHPDRYDLFHGVASFEWRRKRMERSEEIFGFCLEPVEQCNQFWTASDVIGKYQHGADCYDEAPQHSGAVDTFLAMADRHLGGQSGLTIIDAACGTGALGRGLRSRASRLIGIDISPDMAAHARNLYDDVLVGDMVAVMASLGPIAHMIVCCGATYYLGEIGPFLASAASALKPGGRLLFSEITAPLGQGTMVTVGGTPRYCRSPDLIRDLAAKAGLTELGSDIGDNFTLPCRFWCFGNGK